MLFNETRFTYKHYSSGWCHKFTKESQNKLGMSEEEQDKKEPKEPDYSKNNEELEDKQQEETGEIKTTTNQVF